jgi:hypothetical protein
MTIEQALLSLVAIQSFGSSANSGAIRKTTKRSIAVGVTKKKECPASFSDSPAPPFSQTLMKNNLYKVFSRIALGIGKLRRCTAFTRKFCRSPRF